MGEKLLYVMWSILFVILWGRDTVCNPLGLSSVLLGNIFGIRTSDVKNTVGYRTEYLWILISFSFCLYNLFSMYGSPLGARETSAFFTMWRPLCT